MKTLAEETRIIEEIDTKIYKFREKHNEHPNFIKIPLWCYELLKDEIRSRFGGSVIRYNKYCNCRMCPTITIQLIDEIEVF